MTKYIKILMNKLDDQGKQIGMKEVNVKLIQQKITSVIVELPNGEIIVRKNKYVVKES